MTRTSDFPHTWHRLPSTACGPKDSQPPSKQGNQPTLFPKEMTKEICWTEPSAEVHTLGGACVLTLYLYRMYRLTPSRSSAHLCPMKGSSQLYSERKLGKSVLVIYFSNLKEHAFCLTYVNLYPWLRLNQ